MSVENQKIIRIKKTEVDRNFLKLSKVEMYEAMRELTGSELKLYLYLAANKVDYQLELSRSYLIKQGITSNGSYDRAVKGLIEKRYLVPPPPGSNIYYFYTTSQNGSGQQAGNLRNSQSGKTVPETGTAVPRAGTESPKIEKEIDAEIRYWDSRLFERLFHQTVQTWKAALFLKMEDREAFVRQVHLNMDNKRIMRLKEIHFRL